MEKTRYEVRRVGVFSAVKTLFLLGGFTGFLMGLVQWAFMGLIWWAGRNLPSGFDLQGQSGLEDMLGGAIGTIAMFFPIMGAFMGAICGAVLGFFLALIYNLSVRFWGGLELEWELVQSVSPTVPLPRASGEQTPLPITRAVPPPSAPPAPESNADPSERRPSSSMYE